MIRGLVLAFVLVLVVVPGGCGAAGGRGEADVREDPAAATLVGRASPVTTEARSAEHLAPDRQPRYQVLPPKATISGQALGVRGNLVPPRALPIGRGPVRRAHRCDR